MLIKSILLFLNTIVALSCFSQHTNVKLEKPIGASYFASPCEPSIVMNPDKPDELIVGSVLDGLHISENGGKTWSNLLLTSPLGVEGDPCMVIDNNGQYHYFHLANPIDGTRLSCIVHQQLDSISGKWSQGTAIGNANDKTHDKEWAVVDRSDNSIYLFWTIFDVYKNKDKKYKSNIAFSKYDSKNKTWSEPKKINKIKGDCADDDNSLVGVSTCVGPNSEVYVAWSGLGKIWFDRSFDKGSSWLKKDIVLAEQPGGWRFQIPGIYRGNGFPMLACDTSKTKNRGNIYAVWSDQRNGDDNTTVFFSKSNNHGDTWSAPKEIISKTKSYHSFFPSMTVDQVTGRIWIVYYERRNWTNDNTEVYLSYSDDGGASFLDFRISKSPFVPDKEMFFGDYTSIAAHNNVVRPAWARLDGFSLSLWTALVDPEQIGVDKSYSPDIITGNEDSLKIVNSWDLDKLQFKDWNIIQEKWFEEVYRPALDKFKIELNCSDCEYAYIDAVIYIDYEGKIVKYSIEKSNVCGNKASPELIIEFISPLLKIKIPKSLSNKAIKVKLGTGLKC